MKHEVFKINPIESVTLQVVFPVVLSIESNLPVEFQTKIRDYFPFYDKLNQFSNEINVEFNVNEGFAVQPNNKSINIVHVFDSIDKRFRIELTRNSLSLVTQKYDGWKEMYQIFEKSMNELIEIYQIEQLIRVGLRYVNVFVRSKLNYDKNHPWGNIINLPYIYVIDDINVKMMNTVFEKEIENWSNTRLRVNTSLVKNANDPTNEQCFLLDTDHIYIDNEDINKYKELIIKLHNEAYSIFSKVITEECRIHLLEC